MRVYRAHCSNRRCIWWAWCTNKFLLLSFLFLTVMCLLFKSLVDTRDLFQPYLLFGGMQNSSQAAEIACFFYRRRSEDEEEVPNDLQLLDPDRVPKDASIFFHETSCHEETSPLLTSRQACAVESAAKMNPDSQVYVLFPSPVVLKHHRNNSYLKQLRSYTNIHLRHINIERYFEGSPLEEWFKAGHLFTSEWPRSHASDLLRYLTLWKFGGIYLDLDVVVVKSLKGLTNFAGAESETAVAAGVLSFSNNASGHELASSCLQDLKENFRGYDWGYNGPGVITRVLKRNCKVRLVEKMTADRCKGFNVYPPSWFYPIPWRDWFYYFDVNNNQTVMSKLNESHIIHVWNKFSTNTTIIVGSNQPYGLLAAKFCPNVYSSSGNTF